jgi:hypothetical protein
MVGRALRRVLETPPGMPPLYLFISCVETKGGWEAALEEGRGGRRLSLTHSLMPSPPLASAHPPQDASSALAALSSAAAIHKHHHSKVGREEGREEGMERSKGGFSKLHFVLCVCVCVCVCVSLVIAEFSVSLSLFFS